MASCLPQCTAARDHGLGHESGGFTQRRAAGRGDFRVARIRPLTTGRHIKPRLFGNAGPDHLFNADLCRDKPHHRPAVSPQRSEDSLLVSSADQVIQLTRERSLWRDALRRLIRDRLVIVGLILVGTALICALFAPQIAPYGPIEGDVATLYVKAPSLAHPFGTDDIGRDVLSRVIYGAQISVRVAIFAEALGMLIGVSLGLVAGYYSGLTETVIMRVVDIFLAFPLLIIAVALVAAFGPSETNIFISLSTLVCPTITRVVRAQVLSSRETEYVAAARIVGVNNVGIMVRHILPYILTPLIVYASLSLADLILQEAALSFLGLSAADRSTPSWGKMLNDGRAYIRSAAWVIFFPGLAIFGTVLGFNLLGDGLREALDVRTR